MKYMKISSLLLAMLVLGAGSAEAQRCGAQLMGSSKMVRAEGLTEVVASIELRCKQPAQGDAADPIFGADTVPATFKVAVEVNTRITNEIDDDRVVTVADATATDYNAYTNGGITLAGEDLGTDGALDRSGDPAVATSPLPAATFGDGELSEDGTMIEWTFNRDDDDDTDNVDEGVNLGDGQGGFNLVIGRIRVNAAAVGDGEDVMANVMVGGSSVHATPLKLADVSTGLDAPVVAKTGTVCAEGNVMNARVTLKEGFAAAFMNGDHFELTFTGIPEGVKVTVPLDVPVPTTDSPDIAGNETLEAFRLKLAGASVRTRGADKDGVLDVSTAGAGSVRYMIAMTDMVPEGPGPDGDISTTGDNTAAVNPMSTLDDTDKLEWQHIYPTFEWDGGDVDLGSVMVYVSFHPVSDDGGDTFRVGGEDVPRFVDDDAADTLLTINDCMTTLFYPFVTSASGYDTGIVVSNTSDVAGACMATYSGSEDDMDLGEIMPGMQSIFLVSTQMEDFSGYLKVNCGLEAASGFAHVVDSTGLAGSQGYIAQCTSGEGPGCP